MEDNCQCALEVVLKQEAKALPQELWALALGTEQVVVALLELSTPARHATVEQLRDVALKMRARYVLHVASEALKRDQGLAVAGADGKTALDAAVQVRATVLEAERIGVLEGSEDMAKAKAIVLDLRAQAVLRNATRDMRAEQAGTLRDPVVAANRIREEWNQALAFGVSSSEPVLQAARNIASDLHGGKDDKSVEKGQYRSGDASTAADRIEVEIQGAIIASVPEDHGAIQEARAIVKWLREQEGLRKRKRYADARRHSHSEPQ